MIHPYERIYFQKKMRCCTICKYRCSMYLSMVKKENMKTLHWYSKLRELNRRLPADTAFFSLKLKSLTLNCIDIFIGCLKTLKEHSIQSFHLSYVQVNNLLMFYNSTHRTELDLFHNNVHFFIRFSPSRNTLLALYMNFRTQTIRITLNNLHIPLSAVSIQDCMHLSSKKD